MEIKKSPKADLERSKGLSFLMGLVLALALVFTAVEWRAVQIKENLQSDKLNSDALEDAIFVQDQEQQPEPEPETPEATVEVALPEEFKVVSNDVEVAKTIIVSSDENKELPPPPKIIINTSNDNEEAPEDHIFETVEDDPVPPQGDIPSMLKWIAKNLQYPESALNNGVQGQVVLKFVVERDGRVTDIQVLKKVDPALDKEAVRVLEKMPKWTPGKQRGKAVRSRFTLPVRFKIG